MENVIDPVKFNKIKKARGYTSGLIAERLGVSKQTVSNYIVLPRSPKIEAVVKICGVLDCKFSDIVKDEYLGIFGGVSVGNFAKDLTDLMKKNNIVWQLDVNPDEEGE